MEGESDQVPTVCDLEGRLENAENEDQQLKIFELSFQTGLKYRKEYTLLGEVLKYFQLCLKIASTLENRELESRAHKEIGHVCRLKGEHSEALEHFQKCLKIASDRGNKFVQGQAHLLLGLAHRLMGNYQDAQEENEKGLRIGLDLANGHLQAQAELAMGIVSRLMKQLPEALDHYGKCKNISSRIGDKVNECTAHFGIGVIFKWQEKYSSATIHLRKCLSIAQEIGKHYVEYNSNLELGNVLKLKKEYTEAKEYFTKCSKIRKFRGFRQERLQLGLLCYELNELKEALEHFKTHLEFLRENKTSTHDQYAETYVYLEDLSNRVGDIEGAKHYGEERKNVEEQIINARTGKSRMSNLEEMMLEVETVESPVSRPWDEYFENYEETGNLSVEEGHEKPAPWKWVSQSANHRMKFWKLREKHQQHSKEVKQVNGVLFCCSLDCQIGAGSGGTEVFVAQGSDGSEKAVKRMLKNQYLQLAINEKKISQERNTISAKYVVKYWSLDVDSSPDFIYLFMDLCEETLADFVHREDKIKLGQELPNILSNVLNGLVNLHQNGNPIIHRDLKPTNILRNKYGEWVLADFGISRTLNEEKSYHKTDTAGAEFWRAAEAIVVDDDSRDKDTPEDRKVRYVKQSDMQVAGMVAYYVVTKGEHPFGKRKHRLSNLMDGKPVGLDKLEDKDFVLKDLLSWMLSHKPEDRPCAVQALKHPYLLPSKDMFELLHKMGNEPEIKQLTASSDVVKELNRDSTDWKKEISKTLYDYLRKNWKTGELVRYRNGWTECLRFIRNCQQHWNDKRLRRPKELSDEPHEFFLKLFPNLPVKVHKIVRNSDWKNRSELTKFFNADAPSVKSDSDSKAGTKVRKRKLPDSETRPEGTKERKKDPIGVEMNENSNT